MAKPQSVTSLPASPTDERRVRMIKYSVAMGIRMLCIIAMLFVQGWWLILCVAGAILLPYFAVIVANNAAPPRRAHVETPSSIVRFPGSEG
jgi:predicted tellurium resistance membrane protein TerC